MPPEDGPWLAVVTLDHDRLRRRDGEDGGGEALTSPRRVVRAKFQGSMAVVLPPTLVRGLC